MFRVNRRVYRQLQRLARHLLSGPPAPDERRGTQSTGPRQDGSGELPRVNPQRIWVQAGTWERCALCSSTDHGIGDGVRAAVHAAVGLVPVSRRLLRHVARRVHEAIAQQSPAAVVPAVRLECSARSRAPDGSRQTPWRPIQYAIYRSAPVCRDEILRRDPVVTSGGWIIGAAACARSLLATAAGGPAVFSDAPMPPLNTIGGRPGGRRKP